jgi:WD40 repeat protein
VQICQAVQHAHQKGVIHRDLKPSNILVADHDGTPVPKIIDFGIAKATTDQRLTDKTLFTAFEQFIGTPAYMSPEQAKLSGLDVDTRSDIYSLGVLLYELLTGKTPFDPKRLLEAGLDEIRRTIQEVVPVPPSTRLSAMSKEELTTTAHHRSAEPPKLISLVHGDLDWIVMKCLEKDRARRYETANGLARDIERHLCGEPIAARPPSRLYRFQKLVRRNRLVFAAVSLVVAALVIALVVSSWSLFRERSARSRAETAEKSTLAEAQRADRNATQESVERKRAESNEAEARERLVRISVANGNHLVEQGDQFGGLLWFVEALKLDQDHPGREAIHRMRIGSLLAECPKLLQLWIQKGPISSVAFSPDGQHLVTTRRGVAGVESDPSSENTAQIWDVNTGAPLGPPMVHTSDVWSAVFSPDGRKLLTRSNGPGGGGYEQAQAWDAQTANPIPPPLQHTGWLKYAIFSPDSAQIALWVGQLDRRSNYVRLWNLATGQPVWAPEYIEGDPWQSGNLHPLHPPLGFSPDGNNLLIRWRAPNTAMSQLKVLDTRTGSQVEPRWNVGTPALGAVFSGDGQLVAMLSSNGVAQVSKTTNGEPVTSPLKHALSFLDDAAFSPDSRLLATIGLPPSSSWEEESTIWDVATSTAITKSLEGAVNFRADGYPVLMKRSSPQLGHEILQMFDPLTGEMAGPIFEHRPGSDVALDPADLRFAKSGWDGVVWLWELTAGMSPFLTLQDPPAGLSASFSENGEFVVTTASDGTVRVVRTDTGQEASTIVLQPNGSTQASVSADGQRIATFGANGVAQVWNASTGQATTPPLKTKYPIVKSASFSPDGSRLATISAMPRYIGADHFDLWDARSGKSLTDPSAEDVSFAVFSSDSKRLFTAGRVGSAYLWDAGTGREICAVGNIEWHTLLDEMGAVSSDGRWVVTPGNICQVWDTSTGWPIGRAMKHPGGVQQTALSPDGLQVATAGGDSMARIWDARSGEPVTAALKHPASVRRVKFSRDGRLLATACEDKTVRLWDTATGESVTQPLRHPGRVYEITFAANSSRLLTTCSDGRIRIWEIPMDPRRAPDLVLLAQLLAGRRIDQTSGLEPLDNDALRSAWETLRSQYPNEFKRTSSEVVAKHEAQAQYCETAGLWSSAIWHLNHLIAAQPQERKWRKWRGSLYAKSGEKEKADADFSAAIQLGAPK